MDVDWNIKVKEALSRTEFMTISTIGDDGSWTNPVEYHYDANLNLYFVSMMNAKHVRNILSDPRISAALFKTERFPGREGDVLGLQLKGKVYHINEKEEIAKAIRCYGRSMPEEWQFFKIVPEELWCFDSRVFGEERVQVDLTALDLN